MGVVWRVLHWELNVPDQNDTLIAQNWSHGSIQSSESQELQLYQMPGLGLCGGRGEPEYLVGNNNVTTLWNFFIQIKYYAGPHNMRFATRAALNKTRGLRSKFSPLRRLTCLWP